MNITQQKPTRNEIITEILNSATHGIGVPAAIIGGIFLFIKMNSEQKINATSIAAVIIYIIAAMGFLLASALYHALVFTRFVNIFQRIDHIAIFLVILGTYTPYTWLLLPQPTGMVIWGSTALLAVAGITYEMFFIGRWRWFSVMIYLLMGWVIIFATSSLLKSIPMVSFWLLLSGGIAYSIGTIFYLWKKIPLNHVWWHLWVLLGTALMFISIYIAL